MSSLLHLHPAPFSEQADNTRAPLAATACQRPFCNPRKGGASQRADGLLSTKRLLGNRGIPYSAPVHLSFSQGKTPIGTRAQINQIELYWSYCKSALLGADTQVRLYKGCIPSNVKDCYIRITRAQKSYAVFAREGSFPPYRFRGLKLLPAFSGCSIKLVPSVPAGVAGYCRYRKILAMITICSIRIGTVRQLHPESPADARERRKAAEVLAHKLQKQEREQRKTPRG